MEKKEKNFSTNHTHDAKHFCQQKQNILSTAQISMQLDSTAKMKFNKIKRLIYSIISLIKSRITMFHFGSKCGTHTVQSTECCLPTAYSQRREPKEEVWPFSVIR
jgi:hypothetical protein